MILAIWIGVKKWLIQSPTPLALVLYQDGIMHYIYLSCESFVRQGEMITGWSPEVSSCLDQCYPISRCTSALLKLFKPTQTHYPHLTYSFVLAGIIRHLQHVGILGHDLIWVLSLAPRFQTFMHSVVSTHMLLHIRGVAERQRECSDNIALSVRT